ncbi:phage tail protein [Streptomyces xiamenensis]|uniref:phage tail protein n=1 Tax=Streptomyces xiamenensis TaxID=408015 RepID=UPI0035E27D83
MSQRRDPASTPFFRLSIDTGTLGYFNTCSGLSAQVETEQRQEGGNNGFVWQFPTRVTFSNITLTRPVTEDSVKIAKWISSIRTGMVRPTAAITALRADKSEIVTWSLLDVFPVRWEAPGFEPSGASVALETLELAHHGFAD